MMQNRRTIIIADVKQDFDAETQRATWKVASAKKMIAEFSPIGTNTYLALGGATKIYREKIAVKTSLFNREPFIFSGGTLYEFVTFQPYVENGAVNNDMLWLIVNETINKDVVAAIEKWGA